MTLNFPFCLSKHVSFESCSSGACLNVLRHATTRLHRLRLVCAIDPVERHRDTTGVRDCSCATAPIFGVPTESNQNLTSVQKELLLWHWKLGHANLQWIQTQCRDPTTNRVDVLS